jgi:riboflavin transporter FmnP
MLGERYTWLSLIYMLIQLPLGVIYFTVFITLIALSLYGIALPVLQAFHIPVAYTNGYSYYLAVWLLPFTVIAGVLLAVATMHLAKYAGRLHGLLARALLVRA